MSICVSSGLVWLAWTPDSVVRAPFVKALGFGGYSQLQQDYASCWRCQGASPRSGPTSRSTFRRPIEPRTACRRPAGRRSTGGGGIPGNGGVLREQHLAAVHLDQQQCFGARTRVGETGEGAGDEREDKSSQGSGSGEKLQGHGPLVVRRGNLVPPPEKVSYLGRCGRKCKRVSRSPTRSPKALFMLKENVENSALSGSKTSSR
jgi:hypothetical protein